MFVKKCRLCRPICCCLMLMGVYFCIRQTYEDSANSHTSAMQSGSKNFIPHIDSLTIANDTAVSVNKLSLEKSTQILSACKVPMGKLHGARSSEGLEDIISNPPKFDEIIRRNPTLSDGGRYTPTHCAPKFTVAIIIPYRDRELQLRGLLAHMHPIWQRQSIEYKVFTVTQPGYGHFNKAKLMNAGFLEASKEQEFDCFVFHDVDLLLEDDSCLYWCPEKRSVHHLPVYMDKFQYSFLRYVPKCMTSRFRPGPIPYFGGITIFTREQFRDINGFSNIYWGWGGEDDDALLRVKRKGYVITRNTVCQFKMFKHDHDKGNEPNGMVFRMLNSVFERQDRDGLNSIRYSLVSKTLHRLYTNITIDVGKPSQKLEALYNDPKEHNNCNGTIFLQPDIW